MVWMSASGTATQRAHAAVADDRAVVVVDEVAAVDALELGGHGLAAPRVGREGALLDRHDRVEVVRGGVAQGHEPTFFGAPGTVTSGWRM